MLAEGTQSEERLRQILESTPDAIIIVNKLGVIEFANLRAESLFGYPRAELLHQPIERLIPTRFHGRHATRAGIKLLSISRKLADRRRSKDS